MVPFVKWAGGKRQLLDRLDEHLPAHYNRYFEPFVGGGALFLHLQPANAVINDINSQLLNVYQQLRDNADNVIEALKAFDEVNCDKEHYLDMRAQYNNKITNNELDAECAALMIWINKHCFNGLYRVNSKGLFNVPYNNKVNGPSMDEQNLRDIARLLNENNIEIREGDFETACEDIQPGDFVYFDSPYVPVSSTASFTDYTKDGFTYDDHVRLAKLYRRLSGMGVYTMLSNHDVDLVHRLYAGFNIIPTSVKRSINSNASKRTGKEVIITNY